MSHLLHLQQSAYDLDPRRQISQQQKPPLPTTAVEYWHSELGITLNTGVDSWAGQLLTTSLPFSNARPVYGADGSNFRGRPVVQCSLTASLRAIGLSTILATGTRPYTFSIYRYSVAPATDNSFQLLNYGVAASFDYGSIRWIRSGAGTVNTFGSPASQWPALIATSAPDVLTHTVESWADGTNYNIQLDSTLVSVASALALTANITAIGVGILASGTSQRSNSNHAFHLLCSAKPTAAEIFALKTWARNYWGVG